MQASMMNSSDTPSLLKKRAKGYFMLFRILPVMVWSLVGALIGTAVAALEGVPMNWLALALVLTTAALVQGYPTHIINEIFDWKSGADAHEPGGKKSGGSKVLQARLLTVADLWRVFALSHIALAALAYWTARVVDWKLVLSFMLPGYLSGIFYTLPPFRFAYRPFLGEWLGGFAGMFFLVLGSHYAQAGGTSLAAVQVAAGIGLVYIAIMLFFHYLDYENDQLAQPVKRTTVVFLGLRRCRYYAFTCLAISVPLLALAAAQLSWRIGLLFVLSGAAAFCHGKIDFRKEMTIISCGKIITFGALISGIAFAASAEPALGLAAIPAGIGFLAHKKFGKLRPL